MEVIEVIEERLFANDDNDELELQYLGSQLFTSLKADLCQDNIVKTTTEVLLFYLLLFSFG